MAALDVAWVERELRQRSAGIGLPLVHFVSTSSTNDEAKRGLVVGVGHGACYVAEEQTAGRGRRGNIWNAAPSEALLFSVVIDPRQMAPHISSRRGFDPSVLTLAVGLGVHQAVQAVVPRGVFVKWPNDVVSGRKKVAGILVESDLGRDGLGPLIVGIGVNVLARDFDAALADIATSVALLGGDTTREALLVELLLKVEIWIRKFFERGPEVLVTALSSIDALAGQRVRIEGQEGVASGFDENGRLLLRDASGQTVALAAGTVQWC